MYKIYWTDELDTACSTDIKQLNNALVYCELLRKQDLRYVTMVSDYANMTGKPGVQGAGAEYVAQLKN